MTTRMKSAVAAAFLLGLWSPGEIVLDDQFADLSNWNDLSRAITWGGNPGSVSAFTTTAGEVTLSASALANASYTSATGLRTFSCLDRQFASPVTHSENTITVDFRVKWGATSSSGESGRFIVFLTHDYPVGGLDTTLNARVNDFSDAWWARPAYQARLRSSSPAQTGGSFLMYGGGTQDGTAGGFERYGNGTAPDPDWWLPGFSSATNGSFPSPGTGTPYPDNNWVKTPNGVAKTTYQLMRYVVGPDVQYLYVDDNLDGEFAPTEEKLAMDLPATSTAPLYQYFSQIEGIRLYWRGANATEQATLDWIKVDVTPVPTPTAISLGLMAAGLACVRRRRS